MSFKIVYLVTTLILIAMAKPQNYRSGNYNYSYTQNGGTRISVSNGSIVCDTIQCPSESTKCTVFKETTSDLDYIVARRNCLDIDNVSLKREEHTIVNPQPGNYVRDFSSVDLNGHNIQCSNCEGANEAEIEKNQILKAQKLQQDAKELSENLRKQFDHQFKDFHKNLNEQLSRAFSYPAFPRFPPGFPFNH